MCGSSTEKSPKNGCFFCYSPNVSESCSYPENSALLLVLLFVSCVVFTFQGKSQHRREVVYVLNLKPTSHIHFGSFFLIKMTAMISKQSTFSSHLLPSWLLKHSTVLCLNVKCFIFNMINLSGIYLVKAYCVLAENALSEMFPPACMDDAYRYIHQKLGFYIV